jgi:formamidopyrimidine-DNA glycosylase
MPELPEVEIVKQSLNKNIKLKKIKKVIVRNRKLRLKIPKNFEILLKNKKIENISRFSKYIILHLSDGLFCIIHLGMSGTIHLIKKYQKNKVTNISFYHSPTLPNKHNHVEIQFENFAIVYNDPRRFGFFELIKKKEELSRRFNHFGPEPFSKLFNINYIKNYFKYKKKDIKSFLLDQKFVSGIGNIYASEILFLCKIDPQKKAQKLTKTECKKIIYFSRLVLKKAIKYGGSSIRDFKNISGSDGSFQKEFKVYQRENLNCLNKDCYGKIKKKVISKRSTFFCDRCQNK